MLAFRISIFYNQSIKVGLTVSDASNAIDMRRLAKPVYVDVTVSHGPVKPALQNFDR